MTDDNPHESLNRERKVSKLLAVIDQYASTKGINVYKHAEALARAAEKASEHWWAAVAQEAERITRTNVPPPSDKTKAHVVARIRERGAIKPPVANAHPTHGPTNRKTHG
jgi:hypothetical protein